MDVARGGESGWDHTHRAIAWSIGSGIAFCLLNALMRQLTLGMHPFMAQFLRYACGLLVLLVVVLPSAARSGLAAWWPRNVSGQFARGALHTLGLILWFIALPRIPLADMTAIGFTTPIFVMLGAALAFKEPMRWERWLAATIGFGGVLIVVGPKMSGSGGTYNLLMLASAPLFAASYLLTKALTRYESNGVILLWQALTVTVLSLPLGLLHWQTPGLWQLAGFLVCGVLGTVAHYCLAQSYRTADISATQSVKFLELVWAALLGWAMFGDAPSRATLAGGVVICGATLWITRRESNGRRRERSVAAAVEQTPAARP